MHSANCGFALVMSCLNGYIFMVPRFFLMSNHLVRLSGRTISTLTNKIEAPLSWMMYACEVLYSINLRFASVFSEFMIHRLDILDLRLCLGLSACFSESYTAST